MDTAGNMFADPEKVHVINFTGKWFSVDGPLHINRSPQGTPLIVQAGQSGRGQEFAARHAEAVFSIQCEVAGRKRYYDSLKEKLRHYERQPDSLKVFFAIQPFVGETEEIAQAKAALHNAMVTVEAGFTIFSGHLAYDLSHVNLNATAQGLEVPGVQGFVDMYTQEDASSLKTVGDIAQAHGRGVSVPQVVGTAEQIAEWMAATMAAVGGEGFLLSPVYVPGSTEEFVELVVPELQRRGLARNEYLDGTLRDNLLAF